MGGGFSVLSRPLRTVGWKKMGLGDAVFRSVWV